MVVYAVVVINSVVLDLGYVTTSEQLFTAESTPPSLPESEPAMGKW